MPCRNKCTFHEKPQSERPFWSFLQDSLSASPGGSKSEGAFAQFSEFLIRMCQVLLVIDPIRTLSYSGRSNLPMIHPVYPLIPVNMDLLYPEHLDVDLGVPRIYDADTLYPWIPETSIDPMAIVEPFIIKCQAPKENEWEAKKPAIEQFYLTENQTLNATIICMREQHGFTAT